MNITVTKRDGRKEPWNDEKVNKPCIWACEGTGASPSNILMRAKLRVEDGVSTDDIHTELVSAATHLIDVDTPEYAIPAGRLLAFQIRKRAYGEFTPPSIYDHVCKMVKAGKYDPMMLERFTFADFAEMETFIDHDVDLTLPLISVKQFEMKYLVRNRVTDEIYESPQMAFMLISAMLFVNYKGEERMEYIRRFYRALADQKISLPTPIMSGVRTPTRQFSSCVLIDTGDSLKSINATAAAIVEYVSQRAGIGINAGRIRGIGSPIRDGEAEHTGLIPFIKHFSTAVSSCSQGGVRKGSATLYFPLWHYESQELMVLKNNRGTEENRCRSLDYAVQINGYLYKRLTTGKSISLFSPSEVPGLYDAFFKDQDLFAELYERYEADTSIRRKTIKATDLFGLLADERAGTGRIYIQHVDHCNNGAFRKDVATIYMSNLCLEIALPTTWLEDVNDPNGEVALCTLAAFNVGVIDDLDELEGLAELLVRALDDMLDYQNYPIEPGRKGGQDRRALGVGVTNYAMYLAKRYVKYSDDSALGFTHELFEAMQFYLLKASNKLAREKGTCALYHETTYSQGILPIDRMNPNMQALGDFKLLLPWEELRADIVRDGLRNSTLSAIMPCETSSAITNSVNGIEPPRGPMAVKTNKDARMVQLVPEIETLRNRYEYVWEMPNNIGYLNNVAIMQGFVDQSISANLNYDPSRFPSGKVPKSAIMKDMVRAYKLGVKTLYYHNTRDGNSEEAVNSFLEDDGCAGGACKL